MSIGLWFILTFGFMGFMVVFLQIAYSFYQRWAVVVALVFGVASALSAVMVTTLMENS